ncbi:DUF6318 family protein [Brachybacterium huguangmaarense]
MASRHASMLAATGVLLLALTACGGDDEPAPTTPAASTTTPSESPAESPSPSTSAPAVAAPDPADYPGMDQQTEGGAKQSFRYFLATQIYAYQSGDTAPMDSVSAPGCAYCEQVRQSVSELRDSGTYWGPTEITDSYLSVQESTPTSTIVGYGYSAGEHTENVGNPSATSEPQEDYVAVAEMQWADGGWKAVKIETQVA